jgi:hypothetical protein
MAEEPTATLESKDVRTSISRTAMADSAPSIVEENIFRKRVDFVRRHPS